MLDTSVIVAAERSGGGFESFLAAQGDAPVAVAAVTASELLHGCRRATTPAIRERRSAFVEAVLEAVPVLPFRLREARRHAELWAHLARSGRMIGPHDMLIGATALANGYGIATLHRDEYSRVPGLRLVSLKPWIDAD